MLHLTSPMMLFIVAAVGQVLGAKTISSISTDLRAAALDDLADEAGLSHGAGTYGVTYSQDHLTLQAVRPKKLGHGYWGESVEFSASASIEYDKAFRSITDTTARFHKELKKNLLQARRQSEGWYRWSLVAAVIGFAIIGLGAVVALLGHGNTGPITALAGLIPEAAAALFFTQSNRADKRVDTITKGLLETERTSGRLEIAHAVDDHKLQNELKERIVRELLSDR